MNETSWLAERDKVDATRTPFFTSTFFFGDDELAAEHADSA